MTSHIVPLPWTEPPRELNLNKTLRGVSVHVTRRAFEQAKGVAFAAILNARVPKNIPGIELTLHYRVPDRRGRDADNLAPLLKACQDALVTARVIHEDSWVTVPSATCRIHPPSDDGPKLWLEIEEVI